MKIEYEVENLHCAGCAAKIQHELEKIEEIENVNLNFYTKKLSFNLKDLKEEKEILNKLNTLADKIEPGTIFKEKAEKKEKKENKKLETILMIASILLFLVGLILGKSNLKIVILLIAYLLAGYDILLAAIKNIGKGQFLDENFLMVIATFGAIGLKDFAEATGVMIFYKIGEYFQERAVDNSRKSIENLMKIKPEYANLKTTLGEQKVAPEEIKVGDIIIVRPGEKIPVDGIVKVGSSSLDKSALTGESLPEEVKVGDELLSGSINLTGVLDVKVTRGYANSTVAKIIEMVEKSSSKKAHAEKFITKFARYYTPIVVFLAVFIGGVLPFILGESFKIWFGRALIFLVISCPCALVLSVPLTFFASIGRASKKGILIKGGNYLERIKNIDTVIFDKTGTLTQGKFKVVDVIEFLGKREEILKYAKIAEYYSNHPIAKAICEYVKEEIDENLVIGSKDESGFGVVTIYENKEILAGNKKLLEKNGIKIERDVETDGTEVYISYDGVALGKIVVEDEIKKTSKETINKLKEKGIDIYILTGDNEKTAKDVGKKLGVKNIFAHLLPQGKMEKVEEIKKGKKGVVFVGDGINDAPVLTLADVGVAMGKNGSDIAIESSDIVLMNDDPKSVVELLEIGKRNARVVMENIVFSLGVKIIVMILGILGIANLWLAIFADVGVSLLAVLNASKILRDK